MILKEARELAAAGYREITLLGQNVNSYGKGLPDGISFAELIRKINQIPGDFKIRFMTSHPKDATHALIDALADLSLIHISACEECWDISKKYIVNLK